MSRTPPLLVVVRLAVVLVAMGTPACGMGAAPSGGDTDLPISFVGPFQSLNSAQLPSGQRTLIAADLEGDVDEPSVVVVNRRRVAFMTLTTRDAMGVSRSVIARASERQDRPPGSLQFESARPLFFPELPWEGNAVGSPSVVVTRPSEWIMVYAAGGAIGLATSTDGLQFVRRSEPILTADRTHGEGAVLSAPSIARDPSGRWHMVYASDGKLFAARAPAPTGPWERVGTGAILAPVTNGNGTTGFESRALDDPSLTIVTTAAGRTLYVVFYTADSGTTKTVISAAASFDGEHFTRVGRPLYSDRTGPVRAGSFEQVDDRTVLLWVGVTSGRQRVISAAIGPLIPRVIPPP